MSDTSGSGDLLTELSDAVGALIGGTLTDTNRREALFIVLCEAVPRAIAEIRRLREEISDWKDATNARTPALANSRDNDRDEALERLDVALHAADAMAAAVRTENEETCVSQADGGMPCDDCEKLFASNYARVQATLAAYEASRE
jgi:hypothetical protein